LPIGFVVTTGNEADVTALEVAATLADDKSVDAILMYAESLGDNSASRNRSKEANCNIEIW